MIATSARFHEAIREDEPQMPLFIFENAVVTKEDIDPNMGFQFRETVMEGDDFEPGSCCSSTLEFRLMNENNEWSDFPFGDFTAYLGVRTFHRREKTRSGCVVNAGTDTILGSRTAPYLTLNGTEVAGANVPVLALALFREKLLAFTATGYVTFRYSSGSLTEQAFKIHDLPIFRAAEKWKRAGIGICYGHKIAEITTGLSAENCLTVAGGNYTDSYEMVTLGKFTAERPTFSTKRKLSVSCADDMQKFDVDYDSAQFSYPTTLHGLLSQTCAAAEVPLSTLERELTNGAASISKEPDLKNATLKDILRYIGELSGTFAKIGRDGELAMKWLQNVEMRLDGHDYAECNVGYYSAAPISKIIQRSVSGEDVETGSGENAFYIKDNPVLTAIGGG